MMRRPMGGWSMGAMALAAALAAAGTGAAQPAPTAKTVENAQFRYAVALPEGCRLDKGPGTIDAVCATDLDPERSAVASSAGALVLKVGAEAVSDTAGLAAGELAQRYGESAFKAELPEVVCGEADTSRVKIDNVKQVLEEARVVYTADVACAEVKFLQLGVRRASVRYLIGPDVRYRLFARAPSDEYESRKATVEAFFASFRVLPAGDRSP